MIMEKVLFEDDTNKNLIHLLVIDTIRVPDVAKLAYKWEPMPELFQLYSNTEFEHIIDFSPVVFQCTGKVELLNALKNNYELRTSSVVFSYADNVHIKEVKQHLHDLMVVMINSQLTFFRFYSSQFWGKVAKDLTIQEIANILGPFEQLSWVNNDYEFSTLVKAAIESKVSTEKPFNFNSPIFIEQS